MKNTLNHIHIWGIVLTISFVLFACSNSTVKDNTENTKTHERLIDCKTKYVMEDGEEAEGYFKDYEKFIKDYFSEEQNGDTLTVTTLIKVNACGKAIGDIEFSGDTLFLKTLEISNELCASIMFLEYTYRIYNPNKKKYKIQSER